MRFGLVAGELSGDNLGAGLIAALKQSYPEAEFIGIAGPKMRAAGCQPLAPMEAINVMGLVEVIRHLPRLLSLRRAVRDYFLRSPVDAFIGIDAPDFNLPLEAALRRAHGTTLHYVSPSVWAWRQGRIKTIRAAVDHMLVLFPFEAQFYRQHGVPVTCVGHPEADAVPLTPPDTPGARRILGLAADRSVVALLPGSRTGEVQRLLTPFLDTARWLLQRSPGLQFVLPAATEAIYTQATTACRQAQLSGAVRVVRGQAQLALAACDVSLIASGTATLEALLLGKPMVVAYALAPLSYFLLKDLGWLKTPWVALPNLLAGEMLVPEILQTAITPERLGTAVLHNLTASPEHRAHLAARFSEIHQSLRRDANQQAAQTVLACLVH